MSEKRPPVAWPLQPVVSSSTPCELRPGSEPHQDEAARSGGRAREVDRDEVVDPRGRPQADLDRVRRIGDHPRIAMAENDLRVLRELGVRGSNRLAHLAADVEFVPVTLREAVGEPEDRLRAARDRGPGFGAGFLGRHRARAAVALDRPRLDPLADRLPGGERLQLDHRVVDHRQRDARLDAAVGERVDVGQHDVCIPDVAEVLGVADAVELRPLLHEVRGDRLHDQLPGLDGAERVGQARAARRVGRRRQQAVPVGLVRQRVADRVPVVRLHVPNGVLGQDPALRPDRPRDRELGRAGAVLLQEVDSERQRARDAGGRRPAGADQELRLAADQHGAVAGGRRACDRVVGGGGGQREEQRERYDHDPSSHGLP